jgi:hypothetical protein
VPIGRTWVFYSQLPTDLQASKIPYHMAWAIVATVRLKGAELGRPDQGQKSLSV